MYFLRLHLILLWGCSSARFEQHNTPPVFRPLDISILLSGGEPQFSSALKLAVGPPFALFITRLPWGRGGCVLGRWWARWRFSEFVGGLLRLSYPGRSVSSSACPDLMTPPPPALEAASAWSRALLPPPPPLYSLTWSPRLATLPTDSTHARLSFQHSSTSSRGRISCIYWVCVCFPWEGQTVNSHHL